MKNITVINVKIKINIFKKKWRHNLIYFFNKFLLTFYNEINTLKTLPKTLLIGSVM